MGFLVCVTKKKRAKICLFGDAISTATMTSVICKTAIEKISQEKRIDLKEAKKVLLEGIEESQELFC